MKLDEIYKMIKPSPRTYENRETIAIEEGLISLGEIIYPKFNNVVILAGGGGSGKNFILDKLIGVEGRVVDVDVYKSLIFKTVSLKKQFEKDFQIKLKSEKQLNDSNLVNDLHNWLKEKDLNGMELTAMENIIHQTVSDRKPNLIFNKTLKDYDDFIYITDRCVELGYDPKNIHLIWIATPTDEALENNEKRGKEDGRNVSQRVLHATHNKVAGTMKFILDVTNDIDSFDGDMWIVPNSRKTNDVDVQTSGYGGSYIEKDTNIKVKSSGKKIDYDYTPLIDELIGSKVYKDVDQT